MNGEADGGDGVAILNRVNRKDFGKKMTPEQNPERRGGVSQAALKRGPDSENSRFKRHEAGDA